MIIDKAKEVFLNPYDTHSFEKKNARRDVAFAIADEMKPGINYIVQMTEKTFPQFGFSGGPEEKYAVRIKAEEVPTTVDIIESIRPHGKSYRLEQEFLPRKQTYLPWPRDVIFNAPATIVFWDDGTKTVVKLMEGEEYNPEVGLAMCFCKKVMGDGYKRWFKDALKKGRWQ